MKIQRKLLLSYLLIVVMFIAVGGAVIMNTMKMAELQTKVKQEVDINNNAYIYQQGMDGKQFASFVYSQGNSEVGEQMLVSSADTMQPAEDFLLSALTNDPALLSQFTAITNIDKNAINNAIIETIVLSSGNDQNKFNLIQSQLGIIMTSMAEVTSKLVAFRNVTLTNAQDATLESQNYANFSNLIAITFFALIGAIAVVIAVVLGRRITNPLKKLTDIAGKVSLGDLEQTIDIKTGDEINDLAEAFQRMINAFKMTVALSKEAEEEGKP